MTDYTAARTAMVDCQVRPSDVTKYPIIDALLTLPRERFVPAGKEDIAYTGEHLDLGSGRFLLDPRIFAKMLDAANIQSDELVLDIGAGMGYSTAVLSKLAEAVIGIEPNADAVEAAGQILPDVAVDNGFVVQGEMTNGMAKHGPYDVIFVQGAIEEFPASLTKQLKDGGRVVCIMQEGPTGHCAIGIKTHDRLNWRREFDATAPILTEFTRKDVFTFV